MGDLPDSIFVDISVLESFARGYKVAHETPEKALNGLNEEGLKLEISKDAFRPVQRRTRNREELVRYIFLISKEYIIEEKQKQSSWQKY